MNQLARAAFIALSALTAPAAVAQQTSLPTLSTAEAAEFGAVGRVGQQGFEKQGCTGTLIAPDLVLTAAHCIPQEPQPNRVFAAGWENGRFRASSTVKSEMRHPEYAVDGQHSPANDIGLIVLEAPMQQISPIGLGASEVEKLDGSDVALVGFHTTRPRILSGNLSCPAIHMTGDQLFVACPVIHGNSGSPILRRDTEGRWQVEAVISSRMGPGSIAVYLPDWLHQKIAAHSQP